MAVQSPLVTLAYNKEDEDSALGSIRAQSQGQTRRIHDLQLQFEEARVRIDKLLRRTTRTKSYNDLGGGSLTVERRSSDLSSDYSSTDMKSASSKSLSSSSSVSSHKSEISFNPVAAKPSFGAITLTVNVDEDDA